MYFIMQLAMSATNCTNVLSCLLTPQILIMNLCGEDGTSDDSSKAENWTSRIYCSTSVRACTLEEDVSTQDHRCAQAEAAQ